MKKPVLWLAATAICLAISASAFSIRAQNDAKPTEAAPPTSVVAVAAARDVPRKTARSWTGEVDIFEEPNRDKTLRIQSVMDDLKMRRGSVVADIGAGGGWFSVRAARRVAPGTVYATEILPRYVASIQKRAQAEKLSNIRAILSTTDDPKLPPNSCDAVLILNAYHEFEKPLTMLRLIKTAMKPGTRLAFIERDDDDVRRDAREAYAQTGKVLNRVDELPDNNTISDDHRLAREIVWREAAQAGFKVVKTRDLGEDKYLVVVEKAK